MSPWICATCGNHYPASASPPAACLICADERQWVPESGQRWTTLAQAAAEGRRTEVREVEPGLLGIGASPTFAIGQRSLLVRTQAGNLLWDPSGFVDEHAFAAVERAGGLRAVAASHPHFYGAIAQWRRRFDAEALLPEADRRWLTHPLERVRHWSGTLEVAPGLTLVQCGGHFPGSAVAHWAAGADGKGALLVGDTLFVTPGADRVTFVWSAPNRLPLPEREVQGVLAALAPYDYDRLYSGWWQPTLRQHAKTAVAAGARRYLQFLRGEAPGGDC